jgi:hypothetical protein
MRGGLADSDQAGPRRRIGYSESAEVAAILADIALQIVLDHFCLRPSPGLLRFLCSRLGLMRKNPRYPSGQERSRYAA